MTRLLNMVLLFSTITLLALVTFVFADSLSILKLFPFIVLSLMFVIAFFVLKLFLKNNQLPKFVRGGIVVLCLLPLSVPLIGLIDPFQVEGNWPLMLAGLVFYSGLGLLSISGIFTKHSTPPFLTRIFLVLFAILLAVWFVFILLNVSDSHLYGYTYIFGLVATVIYLISLIASLVKRS